MMDDPPREEPDAMTSRFHRRSVLALAAATVAPAAWSQAADSTLAQIRQLEYLHRDRSSER